MWQCWRENMINKSPEKYCKDVMSYFIYLSLKLNCVWVKTLVGQNRTPGQWLHSRSHLHCGGQPVIYCVWFLAVRFIVILWRIYVGPRHDTFIVLTLGTRSLSPANQEPGRATCQPIRGRDGVTWSARGTRLLLSRLRGELSFWQLPPLKPG